MHASELIGSPVEDCDGRRLGPLQDLRVDAPDGRERLVLRWLVVGGGNLAHRFGYIDGRTHGPALLERLVRRGDRDRAIAVPAAAVASWGPDTIRLRETADACARPVEDAAAHW